MPLLFSYGTLQLENVQLATFGRRLAGRPAELPGFETRSCTVLDPTVVASSGTTVHAIATCTGDETSRVAGTVFEVTQEELERADRYEPAGYVRVLAKLASGEPAWVYVEDPAGARRAGYIHGTDPGEQARLTRLNALTNRRFVDFIAAPPGARVLEVGSGLGLLAAAVAGSAAGIQVTGVEIAPEQIAAAVRVQGVRYVPGDAHDLRFADGAFDVVYARYLLEHVAEPRRVVAEMRRVTRPGGEVLALENDISLLRIDPPCAAFEVVWAAFIELQRRLGGDPLIGRRLLRLFRDAGFPTAELSLQPEVHWHGSPSFPEWLDNIAGNVRGARTGLISHGFLEAAQIDRGLDELMALAGDPDASTQFAWSRVRALR